MQHVIPTKSDTLRKVKIIAVVASLGIVLAVTSLLYSGRRLVDGCEWDPGIVSLLDSMILQTIS